MESFLNEISWFGLPGSTFDIKDLKGYSTNSMTYSTEHIWMLRFHVRFRKKNILYEKQHIRN